MSEKIDIIVVGSGPSAAHAASELSESGFKIAVMDIGIEPDSRERDKTERDFEAIRTSENQSSFFFGDKLGGIISNEGSSTHASSMLSGARSYVSEKTDLFLPIENNGVVVMQSLAKGGLSEAWGAACDFFTDKELISSGIDPKDMKHFYQKSIDCAGISGNSDGYKLQPQARIDDNARMILGKYKKISPSKINFSLYPPLLALLTKNKGKRKATKYQDLDYWINSGNSIYRSRFTIEDLHASKKIKYLSGCLVDSFKEDKSGVTVNYTNVKNGKSENIKAKYLMLCAGAVNTARIVLKSQKRFNEKIPFMIKEHIMMPCINLGNLGKKGDRERHSLCQLSINSRRETGGMDASFTQLYSYKSLLLYKLAEFAPISRPEALKIFSCLAPSFVIADTRFPSLEKKAYMLLTEEKHNKLVINSEAFVRSRKEELEIKLLKKFLLRLGLYPIKTVQTPLGSTAHYAGGVDVDDKGKLANSSRVYIGDSASWKSLPAKPPALTIMANARRVAFNLASDMKNNRIYKRLK